ncbi:ribosomal-protein-alanine N-acetyltransferase [Nostocoides sp. F2B08]|uniref:ribosomal protein S18-alanine N-acetyltransferase n=1 Tax=Nostocoides sp. F2B08 TaxID=2653936 RepID=UPI001263C37A|nr:ribosomal protein S18-alanine N-acetyltransferase [Tetrasphaera sp. F2B08]KAB7743578.1 ribosomal-protein-alanine N-acetyltransferase [Tetrasphaera sp. F2B08]
MSPSVTDHVVGRALSWADIPRLVELEGRLFADDAWSAPTWWAELAARPRRDYVALESDGELVGYAGLDLAGEVADVMTIAVAPEAQGRGLGGELLALMASRAREAGAAYLLLEVRDDNAGAKALYARAGFEVVTVRRRYYQPGDVDALVMRLRLRDERDGVGDTNG